MHKSFTTTLALLIALGVSHPVLAGPGAEIYNEFVEKEVIYPDEAWQDYVTEVGERVLAVTPHAGKKLYIYGY